MAPDAPGRSGEPGAQAALDVTDSGTTVVRHVAGPDGSHPSPCSAPRAGSQQAVPLVGGAPGLGPGPVAAEPLPHPSYSGEVSTPGTVRWGILGPGRIETWVEERLTRGVMW